MCAIITNLLLKDEVVGFPLATRESEKFFLSNSYSYKSGVRESFQLISI